MKNEKPVIERIKSFLESDLRNLWIIHSDMQLYVRKSFRHVQGVQYKCFDIASIQIKEKLQGKGVFKDLLKEIEVVNPYDMILVESVLNEKFAKFFLNSEKWHCYNNLTDTFYKMNYE